MAPGATIVEFDAVKKQVPKSLGGNHEEHDLVLRTFRVLIADLVQHFNGGHPGYVSHNKISNTKEREFRRC